MASILIIDDDKFIRKTFLDLLAPKGHDVFTLETAEAGLAFIGTEEPDLIFLDLKLPGMDGLSFLEKLRLKKYDIPVVVITGYANVDTSVQAMKLGAKDYIRKPFNIEEILLIVDKIVQEKQRDDQLAYFQKQKDTILGYGDIIGNSKPMQNIYRFIDQVAASPKTTVLIRGETGTGKELVARAIHYKSERGNKPFIEVNCSAFQETLLEAELFGYEAGAFTNATQRKKGLMELAHNGSFFLDEIGDMAPGLQAKILKVLEKQTFRRVGGTKEIMVDTRIISASSRDIDKCIKAGTFREDLYYRLNVATVELPPLRERKEDVLILAEHFLKSYNAEFKKNILGISDSLKDRLINHSWPGNVRELKNTIERAVLFEQGKMLHGETITLTERSIKKEDEPGKISIGDQGVSLYDLERSLIIQALHKANYNQTKAAGLLGLTRETLKYRLKKYKIKH
ncbi:sigma-54 dependent transcriptional regulator [bacterium]|nr:sigma-54 dependent transcriptional regulator [bacterium]MBU1065286.1 sigma-54 dependent transcriptional regulator [bacterium]MBU1635362.1 sigma-54 dependent transcriptional regulator [bacterium]MBU1875098.1 sigma-54 dependent transcriptional regulator [bacterium]